MSKITKPIDPTRALEFLKTELINEAYSARLPLKEADRKKRIITMIEMKLAGRLGAHEALPDGWR